MRTYRRGERGSKVKGVPRNAHLIPRGDPGSWTWWKLTYTEDVHAQLYVQHFADLGGMTLEQVGEAMGCTRERVRQLQETALRKLKRRGGLLDLLGWLEWAEQERTRPTSSIHGRFR